MFNFFKELKKDFSLPALDDYNLINLSGHALYVEGHLGVLLISENELCFKVKGGVVRVIGEKLRLKDLSPNTLCIEGNIFSQEVTK